MDSDVLREQLTKLHEELGRVSSVDPRSTQLLGEIMQDIKRLTESSAASPGGAPQASSLPDRLEEIAVRFEVQHPTLAASSRRLVDMLVKVGL
jgi:hypothetical protein